MERALDKQAIGPAQYTPFLEDSLNDIRHILDHLSVFTQISRINSTIRDTSTLVLYVLNYAVAWF